MCGWVDAVFKGAIKMKLEIIVDGLVVCLESHPMPAWPTDLF